jgi:hypothetical protein
MLLAQRQVLGRDLGWRDFLLRKGHRSRSTSRVELLRRGDKVTDLAHLGERVDAHVAAKPVDGN